MMIDGQLYGRDVKLYADRPANVYEMLTAAAEKHPEKEAIIKDMTRLRYQDLKQQVDTVAANLLQEGINKGDRVALLLTNEVEFVLTALACAKMGAIFVPLNTRLTPDELTYMLTHSGAKLLVTQEKFALPLVDWMVGNEQLQSCLLIDSVDLSKGLGSFADVLLKEPEAEASFTPPEETDALYIMYTSGTTGLPKGAVGSHINVIHSSLSYQHVLKTSEQTRTLIAVPLFHVTGMIGQLFHMLLTGGTIVLMERYRTEPFIQTILEERISFLFNVPTIYVMIMNSPSLKEHSFDFVRTIAYGGAPMAEETIRELAIYFPNATFHNAYGATETSSPATIMPLNYPMEKVSSVG
ncbi:MAG TPA: class I adenylate-forming enzyme family protein, partial [Chondromyces sp.]|nr:class I adenylate-forming enzyme family protein [Chondromyces sp.]